MIRATLTDGQEVFERRMFSNIEAFLNEVEQAARLTGDNIYWVSPDVIWCDNPECSEPFCSTPVRRGGKNFCCHDCCQDHAPILAEMAQERAMLILCGQDSCPF